MKVNRRSPRATWLGGHLGSFGRDPLGFLESTARDYGDVVPLRFFNQPVILLNDASLIEEVLATKSKSFRKTIGYRTPFMRRLFGQGLLTSEGEFWTRQRRLAQPAFHRDRINTYARWIVEFASRALDSWAAAETRPIHRDMMRLTTEVVVKSLFNSGVPREIENLDNASAVVMKKFTEQWSGLRMLLLLLPTRSSRQFERVMGELDQYIHGLIQERRVSGLDTGDLLSMLLKVRDDDGTGMSDRQLRDELVTLMVAGLDTTALALSWSFYLLARHPHIQQRLVDETREALGGRPPEMADMPRLKMAEAVIKETMRLYPPGWILGRESMQEVELGGERYRAGTSFIMSQWIKHRDGRHFPGPLEFRPERWLDTETKLPKFAYFPFGGGPRICIGNAFAMLEAVLVLSMVAQKFRVSCEPDYVVRPFPSITLQPEGGIHLRVERHFLPERELQAA